MEVRKCSKKHGDMLEAWRKASAEAWTALPGLYYWAEKRTGRGIGWEWLRRKHSPQQILALWHSQQAHSEQFRLQILKIQVKNQRPQNISQYTCKEGYKIQDKKNNKRQRISLYECMKADLDSSLFLFVYLTQKSRRKVRLLCTFTKTLMNSKIILSTFKNESMECAKIYKLLQWERAKWFLKNKILMDDVGSWPTHKRS